MTAIATHAQPWRIGRACLAGDVAAMPALLLACWLRRHRRLVRLRRPLIAGSGRTARTSSRTRTARHRRAGLGAVLLRGDRRGRTWSRRVSRRLRPLGPWLIVLGLVARGVGGRRPPSSAVLPLPFFAPPQAFWRSITDDWPRLGDSVLALAAAAGCAAIVDRRRRRASSIGVAHRLVERVGYWVASGAALDRAAARHRLAAAGVLRLPDQRQRQHLPDRAGHRLSR